MEEDHKTNPQPNQEQDRPNSLLLHSLTLRPFNLSDIDDITTWASDDRVVRVHPRGPCTTKAQALDLLNGYILPHPWYHAICIENRSIRSIAVKPVAPEAPGNEHGHKASIGYGLPYDYWGWGIATAAVKMAVAAVFKEWPQLERLEALVEVGNKESQRALQMSEGSLRKYVVSGESVDVVMYSFLSSDSLVD